MDPFQLYGFTGAAEAETAWMANVHNSPSMNILHQAAGSSQPSRNQSDPNNLARRERDRQYRENKKKELVNLKRKVGELTEEYKVLEEENASLKEDVDRKAKDWKQCKKDVCQLRDKQEGQTTTIAEMSKALAKSKHVDVKRENEKLKRENALLINQINNPNTMEKIQLQAKIEQLESEVSSLQLVIEALCKKMKTDN